MPQPDPLARARSVLEQAPLVDGHNDLPWALRELPGADVDSYDLATRLGVTHTDLVRAAEGGLGAQFWSVFVPSTLPPVEALAVTLEQVDLVHRMLAAHPDRLALAGTAQEVESVFASGRIASLLGAEGGHSIGGSLAALRCLYALGVRYLTLTHNDNVSWADSATDEPRLHGLSEFGREVVGEMNRLGMLVDLSHVSPDTMRDALDTTAAPVIFSHSSCRALVEHPRNVPDEVLARLADNGGVCMVAFVPSFVCAEAREWDLALHAWMAERGLDTRDFRAYEAAGAEFARVQRRPVGTAAQVADHIEHVREVAGIDHVGIGSDFDGCDALPADLYDVSCYPNLFAELLERGWSEPDCRQLAGGNVLRALRDAEAVASRLRQQRTPSTAREKEPGCVG